MQRWHYKEGLSQKVRFLVEAIAVSKVSAFIGLRWRIPYQLEIKKKDISLEESPIYITILCSQWEYFDDDCYWLQSGDHDFRILKVIACVPVLVCGWAACPIMKPFGLPVPVSLLDGGYNHCSMIIYIKF